MSENRHQRIDRRQLAFGEMIADRLEQDPGLLQVALDNLDRWRGMDPEEKEWPPAYREWADILEHWSLKSILELLRSDSQEAVRLRQSSPFAGIVSAKERWEVLRRYDA